MDNGLKFKVNQDYMVESFDGEILLYTVSGNKAVYLNESAHAVWQLCKEGCSVGEIIAYLKQAYPEQQDQISSDVVDALALFESNRVIELSGAE